MTGSALMTAMYEPLICAGNSRTSEATEKRMDAAGKRKERALRMRDEFRTRHPKASESQIAGLIAEKLQVSKKTVQNYFSSVSTTKHTK
ncbi:hypothetical protein [Vibrio ishigakensis]|uniref:hypothetical protein n=1 Tax=Vibrio ishigakensis TaxID=1481914 RepID=UPI0021C398BA|nr:hypothetical protein [Vibrio ishigakensis]